jgi:extracellular elastinolytic metalloproteinase
VADAQGKYSIDNVLPGTYQKLVVAGQGYEVLNQSATVAPAGTTADCAPRRDCAASQGGGQVTGFNLWGGGGHVGDERDTDVTVQ